MRGQEPLSCCVASPARCGEGSGAVPAPGDRGSPRGPWQPPCPPGSLRGRAREVLCCILSRGAGGTLPAPSSSHTQSPDLVPCCRRSWPQPTAMPPPELSTSRAGWASCPAASGAGNAPGTEATHGTCSQPSRHSLSQPACGCQHRAMQQVKHRRGAKRWAGPGPTASVAMLSTPPATFPGRDRAPSPAREGTGSLQPATGSLVNAELWFAQGVGLKLVFLPNLLLCSNQ